ncbi:MAG: PQQ-dependent sugar dehydrogenase [Alphaproteobacteria bacterium]|nr:PQQ-dependent sugar dehydrogenase [Alphaproteobacteria bacterium]
MDGTFRAEHLTGGAAADTISGGEGADTLNGGGGNDVIYGFGPADVSQSSGLITATRVASGLDSPVYAVSPPGDPDRLFIVEQHTGKIQILDLTTGQMAATPFLDIPDAQLATGGEQGLLGLAFDPDYATNGKFYVNLTNAAGDTEVREYTRATADTANAGSARPILRIDQPFDNHNGGWMDFGPDGFLYIATGDGGSGGDPNNNAQNVNSLLGKLLRIDPSLDAFPTDATRNYAIPTGNPFAGATPGADEIYATGLRNPWRNGFDTNGDLWIGDVGQGSREEIDYVAAGTLAGLNFGWRVMEGDDPYDPPFPGNVLPGDPSLTGPLLDYGHGGGPFEGDAVTGGYVYRGPGGATGNYFFADFISGNLWTVRQDGGAAINLENRNGQIVADAGNVNLVASFALDGQGRLYTVGLDGEVHRLTPSAGAGDTGDRLLGGNGNDSLYAGVGNDTLEGGAGADLMSGGIGDDIYIVDSTADQVAEGGGRGFDRVITTASFTLAPNVAVEVLRAAVQTSTAAIDLAGNEFAQTITGNDGRNVLKGEGGADRLYGYHGRDFLSPGADAAIDLIVYREAADSTGGNRDEVKDLNLNQDRFVLPVAVGAVLPAIGGGALNQASFNGDIAAAVNAAFGAGGAIEAVLFTPGSGNQSGAGRQYLVVDMDNDGSYSPAGDLVVELVNAVGTLDRGDFIYSG